MMRPARNSTAGAAGLIVLAAALFDTTGAVPKEACTGPWTTPQGVSVDCMNISFAAVPVCSAVIHIAGASTTLLLRAPPGSRAPPGERRAPPPRRWAQAKRAVGPCCPQVCSRCRRPT